MLKEALSREVSTSMKVARRVHKYKGNIGKRVRYIGAGPSTLVGQEGQITGFRGFKRIYPIRIPYVDVSFPGTARGNWTVAADELVYVDPAS